MFLLENFVLTIVRWYDRTYILVCLSVNINVVIDCGSPPVIENGYADTSRNTTYLSVAKYKCQDGYFLSKNHPLVTCQEGGEWVGDPPHCQGKNLRLHMFSCIMFVYSLVVDCGEVEVANGSTDLVLNSTTYQSILIHNCSVGYTLVGPSERRCLSDGYWSGRNPTCESM